MRLTREEIRRMLQISVCEDAVAAFNALGYRSRASVLTGSDDLKRMVLMVIDRGVALGLQAGGEGEGKIELRRGHVCCSCSFGDSGLLLHPAPGETLRFGANYYGQMQLHQWLEGWEGQCSSSL